MPRRKRKKRETQHVRPVPAADRRGHPRYLFLVAAGAATLAIGALIVLGLRPLWQGDRELTEGALGGPESARELDALSGQVDGPSSVEGPIAGPAAEFQAELYGIVEPLVQRLPNSTLARCLLASVHQRFAKRAEATRVLQQCLALDPACVEAHHSLGLLALGAGDYAAAEKHLRDAFDIDPLWADVPLRLARVQMSQGKPRAAVVTLETYLRMTPSSLEAWCQLGQAYQQLGDYANAKRCHLTAIELDPNSVEAHYGVAKALRELGKLEESREFFEKSRRMQSSNTATVRSNKAALTDEHFVRMAIVETATKAGAVYAMHGFLAEAEKCWIRATTLDPTHTECQEMLCRLKPDHPEHWLSLGHLYIRNGHPAEAEEPFRRVIGLAPQRADGYAALAQVYMLTGKDAEEAFQLAQRAVQLESTAPNYFVLAAACERVEDSSGAAAALERAIELDPDDPQYREAYAKLQKEQRP